MECLEPLFISFISLFILSLALSGSEKLTASWWQVCFSCWRVNVRIHIRLQDLWQGSLQKLSRRLWPVKGASEVKDIYHPPVLNPRLKCNLYSQGQHLKKWHGRSPPIPFVILSSTEILLNTWWSLCISLMSDFMLVVWCLALCPNTQQRANVSIWRSLLRALGGISWENCPASYFFPFLLQTQSTK